MKYKHYLKMTHFIKYLTFMKILKKVVHNFSDLSLINYLKNLLLEKKIYSKIDKNQCKCKFINNYLNHIKMTKH